ncbi:VanZ family protein [Streptomyces sp. NPDC012461]|uniref:VanZ family protein n=1 Tax=unclassified Streptomyces TaxID=2593676 RepID=UPI0033DC0A9A
MSPVLTAVFRGHEGFVVVGLVVVALAATVTYRAARTRTSRPGILALWVSAVTSLVVLTTWTTGSIGDSAVCVVNKDILEPFRGSQGLLNAGMFVPFGLLGVMATRRPALVALLGVLLSATIETLQGSASVVGRLCDTSDLVANSTGVLAGTAFGMILTRFDADTEKRLAHRTVRIMMIACCVTAIAIAATWVLRISPHVVERTVSDVEASQDQRNAIASAVRSAFGDHYSLESVRFTHGEGDDGTVVAALSSERSAGAGSAELTWPDNDQLSVNLVPTAIEEGHSFTVPDAPNPVANTADARRAAVAYAQRYAPWALEGSQLSVTPLDAGENTGWLVSWRKWEGKVLLPMRLDVQLERGGRLTDLIARNVPDPELPPVRWKIDRAWTVFERHFAGLLEGGDRQEPVLLAQRREGHWRVDWLLTVRTPTDHYSAVVDASTGELHSPEHIPRTAEHHLEVTP